MQQQQDFLERISHFSPKRLALLALELQQRVEALEQAKSQPIAIVGIGCRFPGGADSPQAYWQLLRDGVDAIREVPAARWPIDAFYDPDPDAPGKMNTRWGGFIDDIDRFDAHFFGISPREARSMDPQQRLLLEVAWEALEHAALSAARLAGTRTAVFVGMSNADYYQHIQAAGLDTLDAYTASGTAHSIASGRLSYVLGLSGPSVSIDTACSSSLVAIHQAVHSLRRGECDAALAGGVNLILGPEVTIALSKSRMMAPDGRCKAFDARADGFVRGEGCGVLVLKRLADAQTDGDRIVAVIRGSAVNQDGRSNGLTAPNGPAQEAVLRDALADARIEPHEVGYVEAHGTGTSLGDPIEVQALAAVLGAGRAAGDRLRIGSVKANIGHLESAAGVAGLIKIALALQHGELPKQLHLQRPNPFIAWDKLPVEVPTERTPWPEGSRCIAGVSSFGFSGTNVHLLLEQAPEPQPVEAADDRPLQLLTVSARSDAARHELAERYRRHIAGSGDALADIAHTANTGRAPQPHRLAVIADSSAQAEARLAQHLAGATPPGVFCGIAPARAPRIAFLFTGQGSQSAGMARALHDNEPTFRAALDRCDAALRPRLQLPLLQLLYGRAGAASPIDDTEYTQPALFAVEYALATLWMSWGIRPSVVMGHSIGELVAACIAGVFSLEDGLALVAERGRLMGALPRNGSMAAVLADEARVAAAIVPWRGEVSIAAVNGPANTVISGLTCAVDAALQRLAADGVQASRLNVSHAFHSPLVEPMLRDFAVAAAGVRFSAPNLELISNVTGQPIGAAAACAAYWVEHVRAPVQFAAAMQQLLRSGCEAIVEIGPHPTLIGLAEQACGGHQRLWLPSLRRGRDDGEQLLDSLATLHVHGADVDWAAFDAGRARRKVVLPNYPFQRQRFWVEAPRAGRAAATVEPPAHDDRIAGMLHEVVWRDAPPLATSARLSPHDIAAQLQVRVEELAQQNGLDRYGDFLAGLDRLATAYIVHALRTMGCEFEVGARLEVQALAARFGVLPRHHRLLARLLDVLAEDGLLVAETQGWRVLAVPPCDDPEARQAELQSRHPEGEAELTLTVRCARELASVLRGQCDPLALLFPGGSLDDSERLYRNSPPARAYNTLIAEVFERIAAVVPAQRALRVLEVGAGTGSTTAYVLERLSGRTVEYTFTDVSPLFLHRAREKFADRPSMRYQLLDIGRDPAAQGFEPGQFDVVLGANVLHATADLDVTLAHVRSLLAPGGLLAILEGTAPQRFGDLTVGLLDGWWAFTDVQRRRYALMARRDWLALLAERGFVDAIAVPGDVSHPVLSQQAVLLAQAPAATEAAAQWLIVADRGGFAARLQQSLRDAGDSATLVPEADALAGLLDVDATQACRGIIYLPALDESLDDATSADELARAQARLVSGLLATVQTLAARPDASPPGLWLVTRGAQPTARGEAPNAAQAITWGLSHVVALEHPELRCMRIDLDPLAAQAQSAQALAAELRAPTREDQLALRGGTRRVRRLVHGKAGVAGTAFAVSAERTHLITGGLRGLGLRVAEWLVDQGARHLMLMARRAPDASALDVMRRLEQRGVRIVAAQGDVACRADVRRVLDDIGRTMPPLSGIVHAAGVLDDGALISQSWPRFAPVLAPKVLGSWHLHQLAGPLDYLVLFSSGASVAGSPGQANHAAANAFEDALAWYRQARGQPTVAINWGPWARIGAAAERGLRLTPGLQAIEPDDGVAALALALRREGGLFMRSQVAVLATDWSQLRQARDAGSEAPLFGELRIGRGPAVAAPAAPVLRPAPAKAAQPSWHERIRGAAPNRRRNLLREQVRRLTVKVLGLQPGDDVDMAEPLRQLGLDSLMAVELRNLLGKAVGRSLPATLTFDHPSIAAIADHLAATAFADEIASAVEPAVAVQQVAALDDDVGELSVHELAALLERRLDGIELQETS